MVAALAKQEEDVEARLYKCDECFQQGQDTITGRTGEYSASKAVPPEVRAKHNTAIKKGRQKDRNAQYEEVIREIDRLSRTKQESKVTKLLKLIVTKETVPPKQPNVM